DVAARMTQKAAGVLLNGNILEGLAKGVDGTLGETGVEKLAGGAATDGEAFCYDNTVLITDAPTFVANEKLQTEHFGPVVLFVTYASDDELIAAIDTLHGNLTATLHATNDELEAAGVIYYHLREKAGRLIWNGYPTGVAVVHAMQHGGPYPATTAPATTSVGMMAIKRFMRPVAYQNMPAALLPAALHDANPLGIWRTVNGALTKY
ncbi:MAG: aldehyde dehydrogenase family protein, partial [Chloroflexota bacterium]